MTIEQDLRIELAERAETFTVPVYDATSLRVGAGRRRTRHRVRVGLAVAALVAVGAGAWQWLPPAQQSQPAAVTGDEAVAPSSCLRPGEIPPVPSSRLTGDGFVADANWAQEAPEGRSCIVVLRLGYHRFGLGAGRSGMVWLYSDGTLITETQDDGFVQHQRSLTASGVERVRALVASELGDPGHGPADGIETSVWYRGQQYTPDDPALVSRLEDLSWLPDRDWQQPAPTVYHREWFLLCHEQQENQDVSSALLSLPPATRSLLESNQWTVLPGGEGTHMSRSVCTILGPEAAGPVAQQLGGDIQAGRAIVEEPIMEGRSTTWSLTGLMPDGEPGAHGD